MKDIRLLEKRMIRLEKRMRKARRRFIYKGMKRRHAKLLLAVAHKRKVRRKRLLKMMGWKRKKFRKALRRAHAAGYIKLVRDDNNKVVVEITEAGKEAAKKKAEVIKARRKKVAEKLTSCLTEEEKAEYKAIIEKVLNILKERRQLKKETVKALKEKLQSMPKEQKVVLFQATAGRYLKLGKKGRFVFRKPGKKMMLHVLLHKGGMSKKRLRKHMGIKRAKMRKMLRKAKRSGLIKVCRCHRGKKRIVLSQLGKKKALRRAVRISNMIAVRRAMVIKDIKDGLTKEEIKALIRTTAKIRKNLKKAKFQKLAAKRH